MDVEDTDRRIAAYQRENAEQIDMQSSYEDRQSEMVRLQAEDERRLKAQRAAEFAEQDEKDKAERERDEKELIRMLEESDAPAAQVIKKQRAVALKKSSARAALDANRPPNTANSQPSLLSKYMSYNRAAFGEVEKDPYEPEDPLADYDEGWYDYRDLFTLRSTDNPYSDRGTEDALLDRRKLAGGFDVRASVWERAIRSAVMGLWSRPKGAKLGGDPGDGGMQVD